MIIGVFVFCFMRIIFRKAEPVGKLGKGWQVAMVFKDDCQEIVQAQLEHVRRVDA
jgi:hypothetical protein